MTRIIRLIVVGCAISACCPAFAQQERLASNVPEAAAVHKASEVVVFNRPVTRFRATFLGVPPDERARVAQSRIASLLERDGTGEVAIEQAPQGVVFKIDGALAFVMVQDDVDALVGESLDTVVPQAVGALSQVIAETRESRNGRIMLTAALWAVAATAAYLVMLWLLRRLGRLVMHQSIRVARHTSRQVRVGGGELLQSERLVSLMRAVATLAGWAVAIALTFEWLRFVLGRFPYTRRWSEQIADLSGSAAVRFLSAFVQSLPDLFVIALIFIVARWIAGTLAQLFDGIRTGRTQLAWVDADTAVPTKRLVVALVWVFALVMAYPYIPGSGSEAFKGLTVLIGLMVSLGGSGLVGQAGSGLILLYSRTMRQGESVRIGDYEGSIVEMRTFVTRLRSASGEDLTLPNSFVLSNAIKNYSRNAQGEGVVEDISVTIGYDTPWQDVNAMLLEAAVRTPGLLASPAARVLQVALADFYVQYRLVCQAGKTERRTRAELVSLLNRNVLDVFNQRGVQIMSPHYVSDPSEPKMVAATHRFSEPQPAP